jgi:hypothetical protein
LGSPNYAVDARLKGMSRATAPSVLCIVLLAASPAAARASDVVAARADLYANYAAKLAQLAAWCAERQLSEPVKALQTWLPPRDPDHLTLFRLPPAEASAGPNESPPAEWRTRWQVLRNEQADALWALARQAVVEHRPSLTYELVSEAVRENPDHKPGRRMLGYVKFRDQWHTPFEIRQLSANKVWHEQFGWLPKSHVERYEKGQHYYQSRWMPAAEEASMRTDLKRGWRVESEHYVVTTDHSLEAGVALSSRLEMLYGVWQQVFVAYLVSEPELLRRLEGRVPRREPKQHNVICYRSREEYNDALRSAQPKIDITLGIYFDSTRTAYFFAGDEQEPGTLYHEATHQLFQETRSVVSDVARSENFWAVEGIACYMESLAQREGYYTLGGMNAGRMPAARHRLLEDNFYVPLAQLVRIGMEGLQSDPRIAKLYSQSAGLADFFMQDNQGRYRDAMVRYLEAIYIGRATSQTLADAAGTDYVTLDRQYRDFMSQGETVKDAPDNAAR